MATYDLSYHGLPLSLDKNTYHRLEFENDLSFVENIHFFAMQQCALKMCSKSESKACPGRLGAIFHFCCLKCQEIKPVKCTVGKFHDSLFVF